MPLNGSGDVAVYLTGLVNGLGDIFDPLGGGAKRSRDSDLCGPVAVRYCNQLFLKSPDALPRLREFVCDGDRQHNHQPVVANLARFAAQTAYPIIDLAREIHQITFVTVLAFNPELPVVDCYAESGVPAAAGLRPENSQLPAAVEFFYTVGSKCPGAAPVRAPI
jgi:hypothetical protein